MGGTIELQEDLDSESEDEAERDERGGIILPSRPVSPATPSLRPSTASQTSPTPHYTLQHYFLLLSIVDIDKEINPTLQLFQLQKRPR